MHRGLLRIIVIPWLTTTVNKKKHKGGISGTLNFHTSLFRLTWFAIILTPLWSIRRVWRYQREVIRIRISNKNRQHNDQKKKVQKDKRRSTKHTYKTKDRVTRTPLKTRGELRGSGRVWCSCSTSDTYFKSFLSSSLPICNF
jgi:hypothetical protein